MKLEFSQQIFENTPHIKFHEYPSSESRIVPCERRTYRNEEANIRFSQFCNSADAPQSLFSATKQLPNRSSQSPVQNKCQSPTNQHGPQWCGRESGHIASNCHLENNASGRLYLYEWKRLNDLRLCPEPPKARNEMMQLASRWYIIIIIIIIIIINPYRIYSHPSLFSPLYFTGSPFRGVTQRIKIHHSELSMDRNIKIVRQTDRHMRKLISRFSQICERAWQNWELWRRLSMCYSAHAQVRTLSFHA